MLNYKEFCDYNLRENILTNTDDLLTSIDIEETSIDELKNVISLYDNLIDLSEDQSFVEILDDMLLKKEEVQITKDSDTFLTKTISFFGIYPIQVLEIQDPEYLIIQIEKGPIKIYKVNGNIKNFYDKLTTKTIEITLKEDNWIYQTSNSGNNWILQNKENMNDTFKEYLNTQELEDVIKSNKADIEII